MGKTQAPVQLSKAALRVVLFGMPAEEAVQAARFHHQWQPNVVQLEPGLDIARVRDGLVKRGTRSNRRMRLGRCS